MALAKELIGVGVPSIAAANMGGQYAAVAAAGSAQGDATVVKASMGIVTGADGTTGVILPACEVGAEIWLFNNAGSTLKVYPDSGGAISVTGTGLGTTNAAYSQLTYKTAVFKHVTSTQWLVVTS